MSLEIKRSARLGEFHLEEAVIAVLFDAWHEDACLGAAEISKRASIFRERGVANIMNDAICTGILVKLHTEGRVERCDQNGGRGGWKLTEKEFNKLKD